MSSPIKPSIEERKESIDNLKTIAARFHINGAVNKTFLNRYPHELSPGHNLHKIPNIENWNPDTVVSCNRTFPYTSSLPIPVFPPRYVKHLDSNIDDPALQIVSQKNQWIKQKRKMTKMWKLDKDLKKSCSLYSKTNIARCPRFVVDFAKLQASDPDPNFNSSYNWYYTGGTLIVIEENAEQILIQSTSIYENYLNVIPMKRRSEGYGIDETLKPSTIKLPKKKPIFEIISCKTFSNPLLVGARQKNGFSIYHVELQDFVYNISKIKEIAAVDILTSASFNDYQQDSLCLADNNDNLYLYDIVTGSDNQIINLNKNYTLSDKWSSVKYYDPFNLVSVDRKSIHMVDIRAGDTQISTYNPDLIIDKCDNMSVFQFSQFSRNLLYVGTNHSLFSYDMRMLRDIQPLQRWTHGMKSMPYLINIGGLGNNEIISLASPLANEVRLIVNTHIKKNEYEVETSDTVVQSLSLPWQPPNVSDSFLLSQAQGHNLKPNKYLKNRLNVCNSGIAIIANNDESVTMLIQNFCGDVFQQEIGSITDQTSNDFVVDSLAHWMSSLYNVQPPLFATDIINMQPICSVLKNYTSEPVANKVKIVEKWRRPLSELSEYQDVLATDLLNAWNLTNNPDDNIPSQLHKSSTSTEEKVSAWLESAPVGEPTSIIKITNNDPVNIAFHENTNEENNYYNSLSQPVLTKSSIEPVIFSTQPITKPKKVIQKRRYDGF